MFWGPFGELFSFLFSLVVYTLRNALSKLSRGVLISPGIKCRVSIFSLVTAHDAIPLSEVVEFYDENFIGSAGVMG